MQATKVEVVQTVLPLPKASPAAPPHHPFSFPPISPIFPPIPLDEPPSVLRRGAQPQLSRSHWIPKHASNADLAAAEDGGGAANAVTWDPSAGLANSFTPLLIIKISNDDRSTGLDPSEMKLLECLGVVFQVTLFRIGSLFLIGGDPSFGKVH
ncbi:hypothetical protein LWI28_019977 [Acer negundo]|uniref:Uncharacterized protein n=1 Tax=Acer negundo TaxID=4023 RepID=A0AAD5IF47_ACENE|nr:hypothetical protein LWI28_019977 [Acer negundo]